MKITESQLRRIIRQEAQALREASAADKFKAGIAKKTKRKAAGASEDQKLATAAIQALSDGAEPYDVVKELMSATFSSDGRGSGDDRAAYIVKLVNDLDPVAGDELALALDEIDQEYSDMEDLDRRY